MPRRSPTDALLALGWIVVVLVYWCGLVVPAMDPSISTRVTDDLGGYFLPRYVYGADELARGVLPLWNPYELAGVPFLGTAQPAVLYPPRVLLFGALDPTTALHLWMVTHAIGHGIAAYALFRILGLAWTGAALATICVALTPHFLVGTHAPHWIGNLAWVPGILAAVVRLLDRPGPGAALTLALCLACLIFAGYPEYVLNVAIVATIVWAADGFAARTRPALLRFARATGWIAAGAIVAALVSAVQWVPLLAVFMESARRTTRFGGGLVAALAAGGWPTFVARWHVILLVVGVPALAVACVPTGVLVARRPRRLAMGIVAVLGLAILSVLRDVPPFSMFRSYTWGAMLRLPLGFFAGVGLETLLAVRRSPAAGGTHWRAVVVGMLGLAAVLVLHVPAADARLLWLGGGATLIAAAAAAGPGRGGRKLAGASLAVIVSGVLATAPLAARSRLPAYPSVPAARSKGEALRRACGVHSGGRVIAPHETYQGLALLARFRSVQGYPESLTPRRTRALLRTAGLNLHLGALVDWNRLHAHPSVLRLLDVRCIVASAHQRASLEAAGFAMGRRVHGKVAFRRAGRAAWLVTTVEGVSDEDAALAAVMAKWFPAYDRVVLEGEPSAGPGPVGTVRSLEARELGSKRFETVAPTAGYLVVSEAWAPGWRATVDGRPIDVRRGDYLLQAIPVPEGRHVVDLRYRPPGFDAAIAMSVVGAMLCFVGGGAIVLRRRRGRLGAPYRSPYST